MRNIYFSGRHRRNGTGAELWEWVVFTTNGLLIEMDWLRQLTLRVAYDWPVTKK